jgi:hypothetical protein
MLWCLQGKALHGHFVAASFGHGLAAYGYPGDIGRRLICSRNWESSLEGFRTRSQYRDNYAPISAVALMQIA